MLDVFNRTAIKDMPIYVVRGNHDCYYRPEALLELTKNNSEWKMPYYYYTEEFEIGPNGEKMGLIMFDSCLALCSNFTYGAIHGPHRDLDLETKKLMDYTCQGFPDM